MSSDSQIEIPEIECSDHTVGMPKCVLIRIAWTQIWIKALALNLDLAWSLESLVNMEWNII